MKPFRLAALLTLVAACSDVTTPSSPPQVSLTANTVWSGGQVAIRSAAFTRLFSLPLITIGGTAVPVRRLNDSTLAATAPITTGSLPVSVQFATTNVSAGNVTLTGFTGEASAPYMSGHAAWVNPGSGAPVVFLHGDSGGLLVDVTTSGVVGTVPDSISSPDCAQSPGISYRGPGFFVLQGKVGGVCTPAWGWEVYPSLVRGDSSPVSGAERWLVMAEVGSHRWFSNWNDHSQTFACDTTCPSRMWLDPSGPTTVVVDPGGIHFTWTVQSSPGNGTPAVFSTATMDTAYAMPQLGSLLSAAYSPGGDTMFSFAIDTTQTAGGHYVADLLAVRSSDGVVQRRVNIDSLGYGRIGTYIGGMALEPSGSWIYIATELIQSDSSAAPALIILDRSNWSVAGIALAKSASSTAQSYLSQGAVSVVPYPGGHGVYVVATAFNANVHQAHGAILTFTTP